MIFFIFSLVACEKILGIDFGSQYIKYGFADLDTSEYILEDLDNKYGVPASFAIKTPKNSDAPLTNETLDGISIKYGKKAIKYLRKHPHNGAEFILNSVVRNDPEFRTSTVVNQSTLLTLYWGQLLTHLREQPSSIVVSFPSLFTPLMRQTVLNSLRFFNTRVKSVTDDLQALSALYADSYLNRYISKMRKVLFVDVGFSYAKVSVLNFTFNGDYTLSTLMASSWSEKCGGYAFAKALARSARLSTHEAEKMLKDVSDDLEFAKSELAELKKIINETVEAGGLVDEVQIIGGASRYQWVYDTVTDAVKYAYNLTTPTTTIKSKSTNSTTTNSTEQVNQTEINSTETNSTEQKSAEKVETSETENLASSGVFTQDQNETSTKNQTIPKVLREFDASNAIALGTLHYILMTENRSMFNPTYMIRKPTASYYVKCGKTVDKFCQRNSMCKQPYFQNIDTCENDIIEILIDKRHAPTGSPDLISRILMTNISNVEFNESIPQHRGYLRLRLPEPFIEGLVWCNASDECYAISYEDITTDKYDLINQYNLFEAISKKLAEDADKKSYLDTIKSLVEKLGKRVNPSEGTESTLKINEGIKKRYEEINKKLKDGEFAKLPVDKLREARDDIKSLCLSLGMKSNE